MPESGRFRIVVYTGRCDEAVAVYEEDLDDWAHYESLRLPGFDGSYSLSLSGLWAEFFRKGRTSVQQTLTGYETIIKFGDTMQLRQAFRVSIEPV